MQIFISAAFNLQASYILTPNYCLDIASELPKEHNINPHDLVKKWKEKSFKIEVCNVYALLLSNRKEFGFLECLVPERGHSKKQIHSKWCNEPCMSVDLVQYTTTGQVKFSCTNISEHPELFRTENWHPKDAPFNKKGR